MQNQNKFVGNSQSFKFAPRLFNLIPPLFMCYNIHKAELQPFASYRLALLIKQVLKRYNYIVCPLKLFVFTLTYRVKKAKTISYDGQNN